MSAITVMKSRKIWLAIAISLLVSLLCMCFRYVHRNTNTISHIEIVSSGDSHRQSKANEFRINYIMIDDQFVPLEQFSVDPWEYEGYLITWESSTLEIDYPASRFVEISFKTGPWMGQGSVTINGSERVLQLYHDEDDGQLIHRETIASFWSMYNLFLGMVIFFISAAVILFIFHIKQVDYWNSPVEISDIIVSMGIAICTVLLMCTSAGMIYSKGWINLWDISLWHAIVKYMQSGYSLYAQVWDNKGPFLYLLNYIGCAFWYPYGSWILETLFQITGFYFCYFMLRQYSSRLVSMVCTVFAIGICVAPMQNGNYSETWTLPISFLALYIFMRAFRNNYVIHRGWVIACGAACVFNYFCRQNLIVIWAVCIPVVILDMLSSREYRRLMHLILDFLLGGVAVFIFALAYLYSMGTDAIIQWFYATWIYLLDYCSLHNSGLSQSLETGIALVEKMDVKYLWLILYFGCFYSVLQILFYKKKETHTERNRTLVLLLGMLIGFPMCLISGRALLHYLLPLVPFIALAAAFAFQGIMDMLARTIGIRARYSVVLLLLFVAISPSYLTIAKKAARDKMQFHDSYIPHITVANYVQCNTQPGGYFASWGRGSDFVNMMDNRWPATRFIYTQDTILVDIPVGQRLLQEYLQEIEEKQPQFFVVVPEEGRPESAMPDIVANYIGSNYSLIQKYPLVELYQRNEALPVP